MFIIDIMFQYFEDFLLEGGGFPFLDNIELYKRFLRFLLIWRQARSGFPAKFRNQIPWFFPDFSRIIPVFPGFKYRTNMNKKRIVKHYINPSIDKSLDMW